MNRDDNVTWKSSMTDDNEPSELERLRHENDCLQRTIAQIDYPCSPHCHGYLREQKAARELDTLRQRNAELEAALRKIRECTSKHGGAAEALRIISAALGDKS